MASDDDVDRLRLAVIRIARALDRQTPSDGFTMTQHMVLGTLARNGRLGIGELADFEGVNPTMMSRLIGKLESAGLVRRRPGDVDGRAVLVEITAAGRRLQSRRREQRSRLFATHLNDLPADVAEELMIAVPAIEVLAAHLAKRPAVTGK